MKDAWSRLQQATRDWHREASPRYQLSFFLGLLALLASFAAGLDESVRVGRFPPTADSAILFGVELFERGETARALEEFSFASLLEPENYPEPFALEPLAPLRGDSDDLEYRARLRLGRRPDDAVAHRTLGRILLQRGDAAASRESLVRARRLDPQLANVAELLGRAHLEEGRLEEAEAAFRDALTLHPGRTALHDALAIVLYRLGRLEEAAEQFRQGQLARRPEAGP